MTTSPRDLNEILKIEKEELSQLTAEEIEMLIEYRASVKAEQETAKRVLEQNAEALRLEQERANEAAKRAEEAFERACSFVLELEKVAR